MLNAPGFVTLTALEEAARFRPDRQTVRKLPARAELVTSVGSARWLRVSK
jgi:hypothetical protein